MLLAKSSIEEDEEELEELDELEELLDSRLNKDVVCPVIELISIIIHPLSIGKKQYFNFSIYTLTYVAATKTKSKRTNVCKYSAKLQNYAVFPPKMRFYVENEGVLCAAQLFIGTFFRYKQ